MIYWFTSNGFRWRVVERDTGRATRIRRGEGSSLSSVSRFCSLVVVAWSRRETASRARRTPHAAASRSLHTTRVPRIRWARRERPRVDARARRDAGKHDGGCAAHAPDSPGAGSAGTPAAGSHPPWPRPRACPNSEPRARIVLLGAGVSSCKKPTASFCILPLDFLGARLFAFARLPDGVPALRF